MCSQVTPVISERKSDLNSGTNHRLQLPNANVATEPGQTEVFLNVNEWTKHGWFSQRKSKRYILNNSRFIFFKAWKGYVCCNKQIQEFLKFYLIIYFVSRHFKKLKARQILARENVR